MTRSAVRTIVFCLPLLACTTAGLAWRWAPADQYAPDMTQVPQRGTAQVEFGAAFAAPGAPPELAHLYGVIHYRDVVDPRRDYDLFFSPSLAIWQLWRYEPNHTSHAQYVGGFHADNCLDGHVTANDRVLVPAIGTNAAVEAGQPGGDVITAVRSNLGCMNNNYSVPFPLNNYQGSGSSVGLLPEIVSGPIWAEATQSLYAESISIPWLYYDGVLDPASPRFLADFQSYDAPTRATIQDQMRGALQNVRLESQIRILPDGTIMLTNVWTDLKGQPWVRHATDGYWFAPDSAPNGRVFYYDPNLNRYIEPFAGGGYPNGLHLYSGSGWVGYFIDQLRPELGLGFYYPRSGGISIAPAHYTWGPSVLHMDFTTGLPDFGSVFRQTFITIGTKEDMHARSALLQGSVYVFTIGDGVERLCNNQVDDDGDGGTDCLDADCARCSTCSDQWILIQPAGPQDGSIYATLTEPAGEAGFWGAYQGGPLCQVGIHTLPDISSTDIESAMLRIPRTDGPWTADEAALDLTMMARHIDAADDSSISRADKSSRPLASIGVYRQPGPYLSNNLRYVELDVTGRIRADLDTGRGTFAWRVEPESIPTGLHS